MIDNQNQYYTSTERIMHLRNAHNHVFRSSNCRSYLLILHSEKENPTTTVSRSNLKTLHNPSSTPQATATSIYNMSTYATDNRASSHSTMSLRGGSGSGSSGTSGQNPSRSSGSTAYGNGPSGQQVAADRSSSETTYRAVDTGSSAFTKQDRPRARSPSRQDAKGKN
jgi:hypothetical protein